MTIRLQTIIKVVVLVLVVAALALDQSMTYDPFLGHLVPGAAGSIPTPPSIGITSGALVIRPKLSGGGITLTTRIGSVIVDLAHVAVHVRQDCVSAGTGNWNSAATWTSCGGAVPVSGDTAKISDGHTVTIPAGYRAIAGISDDGTVPAVNCASNSGTGILVVNGTLTFRGNVDECRTWTVNAGSILEHDSTLASAPTTTHYRWVIGTRLFPTDTVLTVRGTTGSGRVLVRNAAGTTGGKFAGFTHNDIAAQASGQVDFEYATIDGCGGATPCVDTSTGFDTVAHFARCDHCLVTNSGSFRIGAYNTGSTTAITSSSFTLPADGNGEAFRVNVNSNSASVVVDTVFTTGIVALYGGAGANATGFHVRNLLIQARDYANPINLGGSHFRVAEFDRVMRVTDTISTGSTTIPAYIPGGNLTKVMCLINSNLNPHCWGGPNGDGVSNDSVNGGYAEKIGTGLDGDLFLGPPQTTTTFSNIISTCSPTDGYSMGTFANVTTSTTGHVEMAQNTICGRDPGASQGVGFSFEAWNGAAGLLSFAKNNIVYCATSTACYLVREGPAVTPVSGVYNGVDYNWRWNVATGPYYGANALYTSPSPPGTHDTTGDPQFVAQRHFLDWGQSIDGTITTWTQIVAKMAAMNDDAGFDSRFTIAAAYDWLKAGYAPQNAAVMTAGDTGGRVGAVDAP